MGSKKDKNLQANTLLPLSEGEGVGGEALTQLFSNSHKNLLNIFCTAGYPHKESTIEVILSLQKHGADMIEIGMPYSDPIADGPVIQYSNMAALKNGMTMELLFEQLNEVKDRVHIPLILMGYLNPVLQYGIEKFCANASTAGIAAFILPDLPMYEFETSYKKIFEKYNLHFIFLVTPETTKERIIKADQLSGGFLYAVSSSATTGNATGTNSNRKYYQMLAGMKLQNPVMIGFGIHDNKGFTEACTYATGAIIGSAYIKTLEHTTDIETTTALFINSIKHGIE
jgi:tryptophan synthase alpha chain